MRLDTATRQNVRI